jgi:large subunit ribosomal protein L10
MGLNLNDKKAVVAEVSAQVANAQTIAIAEYRGIEVGDLTVLRKQARESGVYLRVLKNTLVRRAVANTQFAGLADQMVGPLIYSVSADPVAAAKVLNDFAKTNDKLVLKAGSYAGKVLDKAGVQALASVPSREELLSKLLYVMQAPVAGFVRALDALAKQREAGDRSLHDVQQLGEQLFAARDGGECLHAGLVEHLAGIGTGLQDELVVGLGEVVENLGRGHRICGHAVNQRTNHLIGQPGELGVRDGATDQGVLQHAQVNARFACLLAQHGEVTDLDTTIFGNRDRLSVCHLCRNLGDDSFFVVQIETHQVFPPIKS